MRSKFLPLLIVAGMTFGGAAFAGTTATTTTTAPTMSSSTKVAATKVAATPATASGTIKSVSTKHMYVVLSDGHKYHLPTGFSLKDFKVGEKVSVTYVMKGKMHMASAMSAA
ncbi:DUF1344 domain-containing protein [bacterium]|nr:DUF1344 domain-containing protein [bacterium]